MSHAEIKTELKKKDDEFVKTLKRQAEDIDTLLQYMSRQFVEMQNAYKEELDEIENAFLQVLIGAGGCMRLGMVQQPGWNLLPQVLWVTWACLVTQRGTSVIYFPCC